MTASENPPAKPVLEKSGPGIYEPVKDPAIISAFRRLYEANDPDMYLSDHSRFAKNPDARIIFDALDRQRRSYRVAGCEQWVEPICGARLQYRGDRVAISIANTRAKCQVGGDDVYDRSHHPVGPYFLRNYALANPDGSLPAKGDNGLGVPMDRFAGHRPASAKTLGFEAQLNNHFALECISWAAKE